uniref:ZP domain-containing protein n=1 Tax=Panagrellus redivivus TaxID=6233 RepID=A0A7E4V1A9_PANRE
MSLSNSHPIHPDLMSRKMLLFVGTVLLCLVATVDGYKGLDLPSVYYRNIKSNIHRVNGAKIKPMPKPIITKAITLTPTPICRENSIGIEFPITGFSGSRIFVSRYEDNPGCVRHFTESDDDARFELPLQSMSCGLKSRQMSSPRPGIEYTVTLVVSYGHDRMTEDDEIFSVNCRYHAREMATAAFMQVSPYAKIYLISDNNTPHCRYSLHVGGVDGPNAENAQLGQNVYHTWRCDGHNYAIKVYECYVTDGVNKRYMLIDENGCSKDRSIMPELSYDPDRTLVYANSKVFKFSDTTKMYFNCLLYMCPKKDPSCRQQIPPACGAVPASDENNLRRKRFSSLRNGMHEYNLNGSTGYRYFRDLNSGRDARMQQPQLRDDPIDPEGFVHAVEAVTRAPTAPVIQYEVPPQNPTPKNQDPPLCEKDDPYSSPTFMVLIVCNFISLFIATVAMLALYRKRFSAKFQVSNVN